jgi:hypothetical protein
MPVWRAKVAGRRWGTDRRHRHRIPGEMPAEQRTGGPLERPDHWSDRGQSSEGRVPVRAVTKGLAAPRVVGPVLDPYERL